MEDELHEEGKRRLNVRGVLIILGVSRSGYFYFRKRLPSNNQKRKEAIKAKIKQLYDESYQNYGAPKITQLLIQKGETIAITKDGIRILERMGMSFIVDLSEKMRTKFLVYRCKVPDLIIEDCRSKGSVK